MTRDHRQAQEYWPETGSHELLLQSHSVHEVPRPGLRWLVVERCDWSRRRSQTPAAVMKPTNTYCTGPESSVSLRARAIGATGVRCVPLHSALLNGGRFGRVTELRVTVGHEQLAPGAQ